MPFLQNVATGFAHVAIWGFNTISAVGSVLQTIADLSVRGLKRALEQPAADEPVATETRVITDPDTQAPLAFEERSESQDGAVRRRRIGSHRRDHVIPTLSSPSTHRLSIRRSGKLKPIPRNVRQEIVSTDYTAGISWNFEPEEFNYKEALLGKALTAQFRAEQFNALPKSKYDLVQDPVQAARPIRKHKPPHSTSRHPYRMSEAEKKQQAIAREKKLAEEAAAKERLAIEAKEKADAEKAAAEKQAREDAEEQERAQLEHEAYEKEEAIKKARRDVQLQRQQEAADRRELKLRSEQNMYSDRTAGIHPEQKSKQKEDTGSSSSTLLAFISSSSKQQDTTPRASGFLPAPYMTPATQLFAAESPKVLKNEEEIVAQGVRTVENTQANEQATAHHLAPGEGATKTEVRFGISPNSGHVSASYKTFDKNLPTTQLDTPEGPFRRKEVFFVRPDFDDFIRSGLDKHPESVPTRVAYGLPLQYDDTVVPERSDDDMPDASPQALPNTNGTVANAFGNVVTQSSDKGKEIETSSQSSPMPLDPSAIAVEPQASQAHVQPTPHVRVATQWLGSSQQLQSSSHSATNGNATNGYGSISDTTTNGQDSTVTDGSQVSVLSQHVQASSGSATEGVITSGHGSTPSNTLQLGSFQHVQSLTESITNDTTSNITAPAAVHSNGVSISAATPMESASQGLQSQSTLQGKTEPVSIRSQDAERLPEYEYWLSDSMSDFSLHKVVTTRNAKKAAEEAAEAKRQAEEAKRQAEAAEAQRLADEAAKKKAEKEAEEARKRAAEERRAHYKRGMPDGKFVRPLSDAWERRLANIMNQSSSTIVAETATGAPLKVHDFRTVLSPNAWLNDEIVNAHLELTIKEANDLSGMLKHIAHNTFFYKNIAEGGPAKVARWMKRKKVEGEKMLNLETVLIPICENNHWTLIVVSPKIKTIEYLDSFHGAGLDKIRNIKAWLALELGNKYDEKEWKVVKTTVPLQRNGYDCGVFTITNARCVSFGFDPTCYSASDMAMQRRRVAAEIINGGTIN